MKTIFHQYYKIDIAEVYNFLKWYVPVSKIIKLVDSRLLKTIDT